MRTTKFFMNFAYQQRRKLNHASIEPCMCRIKYLSTVILLSLLGSPAWAIQSFDKYDDSTRHIKEKIRSNFKKTRSKKARQIKRIETKDSTILYSADKLRTQIVHVLRYITSEKTELQFTYDEDEVIQIGVIKKIKKLNGKGYKSHYSSYHFDNENLFYSSQGDNENLTFLISEAERYLKQGKLLLLHH